MHRSEPTTLSESVEGILIPDGTPMVIDKGSDVMITQRLGGKFTCMTDRGFLVRIDGKYAEALGVEPLEEPEAPSAIPGSEGGSTLEEQVWDRMRTCYDPEIPVNIVELGLIYKCDVHPLDDGQHRVRINMTLTAPGCGMGDILKMDVEQKVRDLDGVVECDVDMVFDPPWNPEMMTEATRLELGLL